MEPRSEKNDRSPRDFWKKGRPGEEKAEHFDPLLSSHFDAVDFSKLCADAQS
jgi:hypothetical protein